MENNTLQLLINYHKAHDLMSMHNKPDIIAFLNSAFDVELKATTKKANVVREAYDRLNDATVSTFADGLDGFGVPVKAIMEVYGLTQYGANKLIKENNIESVGVFSLSDPRRDWHFYDIIATANATVPTIRRTQYAKLECTTQNLAEALYIINKSAKTSRNTKKEAYQRRKHTVCRSAKVRENNLYELKDAALKKMIADGKADFVGVCKQILKHGTTYLAMYRVDNFTFHVPYTDKVPDKLLPNIEGEISAERTWKVSINFTQAVDVLQRYTGIVLGERHRQEMKLFA